MKELKGKQFTGEPAVTNRVITIQPTKHAKVLSPKSFSGAKSTKDVDNFL